MADRRLGRAWGAALALTAALAVCSAQAQEPLNLTPDNAPIGMLAKTFLEEGHRLEAAGDLAGAQLRYEKALELEPAWHATCVHLGRVQEALGDVDGAEATYARAPYYDDAVLALAALYEGSGRGEAALAQYRRLRNLRPGASEPLLFEARALAEDQPQAAQDALVEYLQRPDSVPGSEVVMGVASRIAMALWDLGEPAAARAVIADLRSRLPERSTDSAGSARDAVDDLADQLWVEEAARQLARANRQPLSPADEGVLRRGRAAFNAGKLKEAQQAGQELIPRVESSPEVNAFLADLALANGDIAEAERCLWEAECLSPLDPTHPARLGDLLSRHYAGRMDAEASEAYGRALARGGTSPVLWLHRAQTAISAGHTDVALAALDSFVLAEPEGPQAEQARKLQADVRRQRPELDMPTQQTQRVPEGMDPELWLDFHRALVRVRRGEEGDISAALEHLRRVHDGAPDFAPGWNLAAEIAVQQDELALAMSHYSRSLQTHPEQTAVRVLLADLHGTQGDLERQGELIEEAAALGSADAHLRLALRGAETWRLWTAKRHLKAYFGATTSGSSYEQALVLRDEVDQRIRGVWTLGGLGMVFLIGAPWMWRRRQRSGHALEVLLERSPEAWPEVARTLSALRHEVLKHNTTVLGAVARAIEAGDADTGQWAARRLFSERGALRRFWEHIRGLERLAQRHGVRLNLRHADPTFGPMMAAIERLESLQASIEQGDRSRVETLDQLDNALNQTAYRGLGSMLERVCLLEVSDGLLHDISSRVMDEVRDEKACVIDVEGPREKTYIRVYRGELEDILANLLRNAVEAVQEVNGGRVGLRVEFEADEITGLEEVVLRVRDDAPRRLSTAVIRGRYIGRGLGLAVDLISRNGGSVCVEEEPGWSKAVVVRLPRAEAAFSEESP